MREGENEATYLRIYRLDDELAAAINIIKV